MTTGIQRNVRKSIPPRAAGVPTVPREISCAVLVTGTALASFAALLLELALTRLFSVVLYYHFAFLAISLAMLGLGAGGVFSYLWRNWLAQWTLRELATVICGANGAAVLLALWVALHSQVFLILETGNLLRLTEIYTSAGVPFFLTGLLFSVMFARQSKHLALLYAADLTGGALGCLAVVPLLNRVGGPNTVICAALAMAVAAGIWAERSLQRTMSVGLVTLLVALLAMNHSQKAIDVVYAKGSLVNQPGVEFARWNALSRVEVLNVPGHVKVADIDSDAATLLVSADPRDPSAPAYVAQWAEVSSLPTFLRPHGSYAIIGPGGGIDVLSALVAGSPNVTGIEINPLIANSVVRGRYADYTHHLYELPQVHIHVSDGRSWIRASHEKYDVIQMTLVDTWASTAAGAFALSENNLYTSEAFREYFDHLNPDGLLAITRWDFRQPREALRVVSQEIEVLRRLGVDDPRSHFIVVSGGRLNERGSRVTVLAKKSPFTIDEERIVLLRVQNSYDLYPLYTPNVYGQAANDVLCGTSAPGTSGKTDGDCIEPDLARLAQTRTLPAQTRGPFQSLISLPSRGPSGGESDSPRAKFIHDYPYEIAPVTDNAPFFFFTFKTGTALRDLLAGGKASIDWKNNLALVILSVMIGISVLAVIGFLILPLALTKASSKPRVIPLLYFIALGLGYILVEIALIQRFVLFLGYPTYAMTVIVFLLLLSGGMGSFASKYWMEKTRSVRAVLAAITALVILYAFALEGILRAQIALPFASKVVLSAALLAPLGFLMGMPFPTGLREIANAAARFPGEPEANSDTIEWAWAMNAGSSVLGSVLAIVIALHFGLDAALGCAAACYLAAAVLTLLWQKALPEEQFAASETPAETYVEV